ncbi:MAG TPA: tetratricopeptide repeat protein [Acidobacteriota bacterium]|nr:tetratricopeptide repeat protein [Acidobacteriota bacterium]
MPKPRGSVGTGTDDQVQDDLPGDRRSSKRTLLDLRKSCLSLILPFLLLLQTVFGQAQTPALTPKMEEQFARGIEARKNGELAAAEKLFKAVLDQGGKLPSVYGALGIVYQLEGAHDQALDAFLAAGRLDPKDPVLHSLAGGSLLALGKSREAVKEFEQAARLQPETPLFHEQIAEGYLRMLDYPAAIDQYRKLLELKPQSAEYHYHLGHAYLAYSISCFERIRSVNADSARLFQQLGDQYLAQGRLDKAIENYENARKADPDIPEVHFILGQFYLKQGYKEKALQAANQALALTPGNAAALALKKSILAGK